MDSTRRLVGGCGGGDESGGWEGERDEQEWLGENLQNELNFKEEWKLLFMLILPEFRSGRDCVSQVGPIHRVV